MSIKQKMRNVCKQINLLQFGILSTSLLTLTLASLAHLVNDNAGRRNTQTLLSPPCFRVYGYASRAINSVPTPTLTLQLSQQGV